MHSKRRYEIFICSVIPDELESFRNYKGFGQYFPWKILAAFLSFMKVKILLILVPKILGFLSLRLKLNFYLENRREFIRCTTKIVHEWNGHLEIFSLPQAIENASQLLFLRTDFSQKTVIECPWAKRMTISFIICQGTWHIVIIHSYSNMKKQCSLDTFYSVAWTVRLVIDWSYVIPVVSPHKLVAIPLRAVQTSFDYQAFLLPALHRAGTKSLFQRNYLKNTPRRHLSQAQWTYFGFSFRRKPCDLVIRTINIFLKG